nr:hypothetical protein [Tanacetum cinerariifolium]
MLDEKLMVVDDNEKPLNKVDSDLVNSNSDSDVRVANNETSRFMANEGANDANLRMYKAYYDIYDMEGLTKHELTFCDMMNINFHGRNKKR